MRKIEFAAEEKEKIKMCIVAVALTDDRVYNSKGYEFEFDNDNISFLDDIKMYVTVSLWEEVELVEPPNTPIVKTRVVQKLDIYLTIDSEQVESNLDFEFLESVKLELINTK